MDMEGRWNSGIVPSEGIDFGERYMDMAMLGVDCLPSNDSVTFGEDFSGLDCFSVLLDTNYHPTTQRWNEVDHISFQPGEQVFIEPGDVEQWVPATDHTPSYGVCLSPFAYNLPLAEQPSTPTTRQTSPGSTSTLSEVIFVSQNTTQQDHSSQQNKFECRACGLRTTQNESAKKHERVIHLPVSDYDGLDYTRLQCRACEYNIEGTRQDTMHRHYTTKHPVHPETSQGLAELSLDLTQRQIRRRGFNMLNVTFERRLHEGTLIMKEPRQRSAAWGL